MSAHGIPDMKYPEKVESRSDRILPRVEWAMLRKRTPLLDDTERARLSGSTPSGFPKRTCGALPLSGLPQGEAHGTREHHTRAITYPIWICCPDHWLPSPSCPDAMSEHLLLLAFRIYLWQRTSKLRFFMFLSFPLFCHGFQRTLLNHRLLWCSKSYQNTKT